MNADRAPFVPLKFIHEVKTGVDYRRIFCSLVFREIVMTTSSMRVPTSRAALAAAAIVTEMFCNGAALASQGPGGGMGTAGHLTQVAMAVLVYGGSALVVGAGLIGAARGR
jgi:hypothetical protein